MGRSTLSAASQARRDAVIREIIQSGQNIDAGTVGGRLDEEVEPGMLAELENLGHDTLSADELHCKLDATLWLYYFSSTGGTIQEFHRKYTQPRPDGTTCPEYEPYAARVREKKEAAAAAAPTTEHDSENGKTAMKNNGTPALPPPVVSRMDDANLQNTYNQAVAKCWVDESLGETGLDKARHWNIGWWAWHSEAIHGNKLRTKGHTEAEKILQLYLARGVALPVIDDAVGQILALNGSASGNISQTLHDIEAWVDGNPDRLLLPSHIVRHLALIALLQFELAPDEREKIEARYIETVKPEVVDEFLNSLPATARAVVSSLEGNGLLGSVSTRAQLLFRKWYARKQDNDNGGGGGSREDHSGGSQPDVADGRWALLPSSAKFNGIFNTETFENTRNPTADLVDHGSMADSGNTTMGVANPAAVIEIQKQTAAPFANNSKARSMDPDRVKTAWHVYANGEPIEDAFWQTLLAGCPPSEKDSNRQEYYAWQDANRLDQLIARMEFDINHPKLFIASRILQAFLSTTPAAAKRFAGRFDFTDGRTMVRTEKGYIGLAPAWALAGDHIVILKGGAVPFVLRSAPDGCWQLVGECYVHGIMNGEAFDAKQCTDIVLC
ncbi:hypothetical protein N656DRAFT_798040 [Canariomyces notabilis]|uniref:Uncharacterized protein n=1 Tax=Canariomyces notabilis TaxID=2074819 RepID=A0AAN6TFF4_9PEZI|nr:hypothetical protein N656DRAFT_798040 [Canariomyces arenarius]